MVNEATKTRYNVHDFLQTLPLDNIKKVQETETLPFSVAAINISGELNISNMVRSAVIFGASEFILLGRRRFDRRGCVGAQNYIKIQHYEDPFMGLQEIIKTNQPVFIEQGGEDIAYTDFYGWRKPPCLVFGSEDGGIPKELMMSGDPVVSISQIGVIRSLNVASAAAIAMWKVAMDLRTLPKSTL